MMNKVLAITISATLALTGCSNSATGGRYESFEQQFLVNLEGFISEPLSGEELIALGWSVCSDLDSGVKIEDVYVGVKNQQRLVESAVINFCPDWFTVID